MRGAGLTGASRRWKGVTTTRRDKDAQPAPDPAMAESSNIQQLLQGLTTGDKSHDQAVRDAFERGYQRGRQDEARQMADRSSHSATVTCE